MMRLLHYYARFTQVRGGLTGLPGWGRLLMAIAALPGLLCILLSILVFAVSITLLLLLTVPVYRLVQLVAGGRSLPPQGVEVTIPADFQPVPDAPRGPRRHIDVTIVE